MVRRNDAAPHPHVVTLERAHRHLDQRIQELARSPGARSEELASMKRKKLMIADRLRTRRRELA